jgi:transglutaminase-like putative cysteine protease
MLLLQEGVLLQFCRILTALAVVTSLFTFPGSFNAHAAQDPSVRDFSEAVDRLLQNVETIHSAIADGMPVPDSRETLALHAEHFEACRLLLIERLRNRATRLKEGHAMAKARHEAFSSILTDQLQEIDSLLQKVLASQEPGPSDLASLSARLRALVTSGPGSLHGIVPYRQLSLETVAPRFTPLVVPAYKSNAVHSLSEDLQPSPEAPISQTIYRQAIKIAEASGKQNWDPVDLYEWVKNNIRTEWYWGSMKGAEETLRQGSGNDADQAALLIALLRAAGYPSRYVRGVVEFFPDLDMARRLTGIDDAERIGEFLRKAGIPHQAVMSGTDVVNYQLEHIWVETLIPYANYRGALADMQGKLWLPLDTSFKLAEFADSGDLDLYGQEGQPLGTLRDDYLSSYSEQLPLDFLRSEIESFLAASAPNVLYNSVLHRRIQQPEVLHILSAVPQFTEIAVTGEYRQLPEALIHRVQFTAFDSEDESVPLFDITLPVRDLSNQQVWVSLQPETVEDQETINSWGGLDNTPSYLVRLRPVLIVNDVRQVVGQQGFPVGGRFKMRVSMQSPSATVAAENHVVVGYPQCLGIVAQDVVLPAPPAEPDTAVDLLYHAALDYVDRWNHDEKELAALHNLKIARPLPTLVTLGGMMEVAELLGEPQSATWQGLFLDADLRIVEAVTRNTSDNSRLVDFTKLSALQGSALEHDVLESHFQVESISTAKLLQLAQEQNLQILTITADNLTSTLASLTLEPIVEEDITAAVAAGLVVNIPRQPISLSNWSGLGYLKESAETGAAGYMLSGAIAGGNTVLGKEFWPQAMTDKMEHPYRGEPNRVVMEAHSLTSISPWQVRQAIAGEELTAPLMVRVEDPSGVPVAGAPVLFTVNKGAGQLIDDSTEPSSTVQSITVTSADDGIARVRFIPGESVFNHPIVVARPGDDEANIAGENLVAAQLGSGSLAALGDPIIVLGFAGQPDPEQMQLVGDGRIGDVLSYAGDSGVLLRDRFGNPVANHAVQFEIQNAVPDPASACFNRPESLADSAAEIIEVGEACLNQLPVRGECSRAAATLSLQSRSDGSAMVGVMLGGVADADYPLVATLQTNELPVSEFIINQHSAANGACGLAAEPVEKLVLTYPRLRDAENRNVDARPVGSLARLNIKSYLLTEEGQTQEDAQTLSCAPDQLLSCKQMVGTGAFTVNPPDQVLGNNAPLKRVAAMADSTAMPYLYGLDLSLTAGLNQVSLSATASYERPVYANDCSGCSEDPEQQQKMVGPVEETVEIWGVDLQTPNVLVAPVDEYGRLLRDTSFAYTILPVEYVAGLAQLLIYADGDLRESILASNSGASQVLLPAGYTFVPGKSYDIQVLLGNPGDANAIYSKKVPVLPVISKVDLHVDGLPDVVEDQIGAFVLLNNDYDEKDRDPSVTLLDVETPTMIREDDELKRAWLHIDDADMLNGTWQVKASVPSQVRIFYEHAGTLFELKPDDPPQLITETPLTIPLFLEGVAESSGLHSNSLSLNYISSKGVEVNDTLPLTVLKFDLAVDGNRDRNISFTDKADESALFWVNNDHDVETFSSEDEQNVEDDEETGDDSLDNEISCRRDLEDFARLQVEFGSAVLPEQLSFSAEIIPDYEFVKPRLNLFTAVSLNEGYLGFGDDSADSINQVDKEALVAIGEEPVSFSGVVINAGVPTGFLYEGRNNGQGRLVLKANYNGVPVLQRGIDLSLYDITYFYDHYIVEESGIEESPVNPEVNPVGSALKASREALYQPLSDEYVMFVHGWNVEPWEKKRWAETTFKRLWWQGYKGKVGLFDWPCRTLPSLDVLVNYDHSEHLAWSSASALSGVLTKLHLNDSREISLLAHSQGNVVAGEALRVAPVNTVRTYVASQAALSASMYSEAYPAASISPPLELKVFETPPVMSLYPGQDPIQSYFAEIPDKVETLVSYFNRKDYALVEAGAFTPGWEYNNKTKPDNSIGYGYDGDSENYSQDTTQGGFFHDGLTTSRRDLVIPDNDFEIFSFVVESRTKALGAVLPFGSFLGSSESVDSLASRDLESTSGYNNLRYSHSRQFRSNIVDEQVYWRNFTVDNGFSVSR